MQLNKYFIAQEFLCEKEYNKLMLLPENMRLNAFFKLVDKRVVDLAVFVREFFNKPVRVNTWHIRGELQYRGWRPKSCKIGAKFSDHKIGKAFDFNVVGLSDDYVKEQIMKNEDIFYKAGVRRLEHKDFATTWTHLSVNDKVHHNGKINVFKP